MKVHGLLLQRDGERRVERRHDGRVAVDRRNTRWCSDGLEIACDNGEKVRVAFALDCCDREAMGHVATTGGITAEDVQDLIVAAVEHRYGQAEGAGVARRPTSSGCNVSSPVAAAAIESSLKDRLGGRNVPPYGPVARKGSMRYISILVSWSL